MSKATEIPFETTRFVRDTCLCLHLQRAARALARHFDEALRPLGLTSGQYSMMMSLNRPEPPSIGSIASVLSVDRTTLTAALKPLQRRRLVAVMVDTNERRSRRLKLTPAGRALLARALPAWRRTHVNIDRLVPRAGRRPLAARPARADSDGCLETRPAKMPQRWLSLADETVRAAPRRAPRSQRKQRGRG
jgi:DNA-binding MarR family transcriptional regulator